MIKHYTFNYNVYEAEAAFKVDTEKFTEEKAKATLEFFLWDYDTEADPIDEVMKKYAMEAIKIATFEDYNLAGVIEAFKNKEGFFPIDGSHGIELNLINEYEFDEYDLEMTIETEGG